MTEYECQKQIYRYWDNNTVTHRTLRIWTLLISYKGYNIRTWHETLNAFCGHKNRNNHRDWMTNTSSCFNDTMTLERIKYGVVCFSNCVRLNNTSIKKVITRFTRTVHVNAYIFSNFRETCMVISHNLFKQKLIEKYIIFSFLSSSCLSEPTDRNLWQL